MIPRIAHVVVGLPLETHFDYTVPEALQPKIKVGQRVRVSFRREIRVGYVVELAEKSAYKNLKPIFAILEEEPCLDANALQWTRLLSGHYACSWGEAIETSLPNFLRKPRVAEIPAINAPVLPKVKHETFLLHDPSLKQYWEHLFTMIDRAFKHGQSVIFLVPEAHQINGIAEKLKTRFHEAIAVLDKQLKPKQEMEQWSLIREGKAKIVVGTRSAVFAPALLPGLIILLEEEHDAYKQEQAPAYHARVAAHIRAFVQGCHVVLISAAPSAETWWQAKENIAQRTFFPPERSAEVQIVDLSNYGAKQSIVSFPLRNLLEKTLAENGKVVLFINRKGFSSATRCNQCGHSLQCPRCEVSLTYLYSKKKMACRRCRFTTEVPKICPNCRSRYLRSVGTGIEKLESDIARVIPTARISRYEQETKQAPRNANIIIATQAVRRILPELNADVLAILQFDAFLNRVDFRSANKVFSLAMELRHQVSKKLVVQTFQMDNYALKTLVKMDFDAFYGEELKLRQELKLPPFDYLATVMLRGKQEEAVLAQANALFELLTKKETAGVEVLDPQADVIPKLRDQYRFTIMLKGQSLETILGLIKAALKDLKRKSSVIVTVNVDP